MAEIDNYQATQTQEQQSEYLKSINQSVGRLVDVSERSASNSSNQFFQGNAVQSTLGSMRDISQGAYDRFSDDLVSTRESARSTVGRFQDSANTAIGTASSIGSHIPQPMAPISATGFFGTSSAYSANYRSTFWNDLWAGYGGERAPQTMFQTDFSQMGRENVSLRIAALSPLKLGASLLGVHSDLDEDVINSNLATSQRYNRAGSSRAISGVGSTRGDVIQIVEQERMKLLDKLGYNYDDFNASKQIFAAGGQFIGTKSELERSHVTFQGMDQAEKIAKTLAVPIQEAARAMMDVRSQLGVTSLQGQTSFIQQTQALGMASGLSFQETMSGALSGASTSRGIGFNVIAGGTLGRDNLASVNAGYLDKTISENMVQSAGGVQNLSSNLTQSALNFANGPGSMYYLASMKDGKFDLNAFNKASTGFTQLGGMASSNASTMQGFANFSANIKSLQEQGGSSSITSMQRSHLNNIFKSATGRDYDTGIVEDTNMMTMLAGSSGIFSDSNTAKAFVAMNFTEDGMDSMYSTKIEAFKAANILEGKEKADKRFQRYSTDSLARDISNIWNKPVQGVRGWFNEAFAEIGEIDSNRVNYLWASGQAPVGNLRGDDLKEFSKSGGFSMEPKGLQMNEINEVRVNNIFSKNVTGAYEGAALGLKVGGAISMAGLIAGGTLAAAGVVLNATGVGAVAGVPMMAAGIALGKASIWTGAGYVMGGSIAAGTGYGIFSANSSLVTEVPGLRELQSQPDGFKMNDASVAAWNGLTGLSTAEKNTMDDSSFQKNVIQKLADKGLGSVSRDINPSNQLSILKMIRETATELGVSEQSIATIAQTKAGVSGSPVSGAELAWSQGGGADIHGIQKNLKKSLESSLGDSFSSKIDDSEFSGGLSELLNAGADSGARLSASAKLFGKFKIEGIAKEKLDYFVSTGAMKDREELAAGLSENARLIRGTKVKQSINAMFGARAEMSEFSEVAGKFEEIANASSVPKQVGLILENLNDDTFKNAISKDPSLKRLLALEGPIDRSMLNDAESFKKRFGVRPIDDLKDLQSLLGTGPDGEQAVKARIAGQMVAGSAKTDTASIKNSEAQVLSDAAATIKQAAQILKDMK